MEKPDLAGRILGIMVFLVGIAILAFVFAIAYGFFTSPSAGIDIPSKPTAVGAPTTQLGASALRMFARILSLTVMCIVGSLVASKGIHLYFRAGGKTADESQ